MKATWILPDGRKITAEVGEGLSLMEAAVANNIPNVIGECGGNLSCATCHVYVADDWASRTGPAGDFEDPMLDVADAERKADLAPVVPAENVRRSGRYHPDRAAAVR